ncbi:cytochrome P450 [Stereum hirsutum FP-91666 SS1]|uniref:cytochrome P450 n=1 Tax=Stereum hirsutum (strain FP-91666) TaxID=721885 RepID=UPI0004449C32|nr:cytochrome P450 [Stereum hirsutum FP-91666 SS1]EIM80787.1 cytochrome P450 [Stereum hirsutum FP-91666 SS1]
MSSESDVFAALLDRPSYWLLLAPILVLLTVLYSTGSAGSRPLPPGPPTKFFSGNVHQIPRTEPWKTYTEWAKIYGPVFTYRAIGRRMIMLNTHTAVNDLLEARSSIYSDRPRTQMYGELIGRKWNVFNISFDNPRHKIYRKLLRTGLNPRAIQGYRPLMERESMVFLRGLLEKPEEFASHARRNAGAVILQIAYGWTVNANDDYFVSIMEEVFALSAEITRPGRFLVESFPLLRYVPSWFPGANFKRFAANYRDKFSKLDVVPHEWAKEQIISGNYIESFTSELMLPDGGNGPPPNAEQEDIIKLCSAALYTGGADTTVSAMTTFFLCMAMNPSTQTRARVEILQVTGNERLPDADEFEKLPYVHAVLQETLRWSPVAPLGVSHRVMQDDIYKEMYISKGSTVFANIWALMHDPDVYPDPFAFNPDRFLGKDPQIDPRKYVFGFGARVCPGAQFAEQAILHNISRILATFDIRKCVDENGRVIEPRVEYTTGVTSHLKPFDIRITPRAGSAGIRALESESNAV